MILPVLLLFGLFLTSLILSFVPGPKRSTFRGLLLLCAVGFTLIVLVCLYSIIAKTSSSNEAHRYLIFLTTIPAFFMIISFTAWHLSNPLRKRRSSNQSSTNYNNYTDHTGGSDKDGSSE